MLRIKSEKKHILLNSTIKNKRTNIHSIESQIPLQAKDAFYKASIETLELGHSIVKVIGNSICEVHPNGKQIKIKNKKVSIRINKHSKLTLK